MFVVWSNQMRGELEDVPRAAALMPDPRARHFWDDRRLVGTLYQTLELGEQKVRGDEPAWDVWLLFGPDARWTAEGTAPAPAWWEHQLQGMPDERRLDPRRFALEAARLARPE